MVEKVKLPNIFSRINSLGNDEDFILSTICHNQNNPRTPLDK